MIQTQCKEKQIEKGPALLSITLTIRTRIF